MKRPVFNFIVEVVPMKPGVMAVAVEVVKDVEALARKIEAEEQQKRSKP